MVELTSDDLNYITAFTRVTDVVPSDLLVFEGRIYYLVAKPELGKAIGKGGVNIQALQRAMNRKVVIIGDSPNLEEFVRGFFNNIEIISIETREAMGESAVFLTIAEKDRGIAIGKGGERIKALKQILKKKFNSTISLKTRKTEF